MEEKLNEIKNQQMDEQYGARKILDTKPDLRGLFLEVTSRCNAKCEHCGSSCGEKIMNDEVSLDDLKKALKDIADAYDASKIQLYVTGGEPLLRKDLFELMEYAIKLGFTWGMTSNGILIDEAMVKKLVKTKMATVSISIDGVKETHESFRRVKNVYDKIWNGIDLMNKEKSIECVQVTTVANKKNINELEDIYKLLLEHKVTHWRLVNCDPIGRAKDNKDILLEKEDYKYLFDFLKEKRDEGKIVVDYGCAHFLGTKREREYRDWFFMCNTGLKIGSILSNGDIFVCPNVERRSELIQGNIKTDNFVEVWEKKFKPFRGEFRTSCDKCKKCKDWKHCKGDSFHTWNFDLNKPNFCIKEIFEEEE